MCFQSCNVSWRVFRNEITGFKQNRYVIVVLKDKMTQNRQFLHYVYEKSQSVTLRWRKYYHQKKIIMELEHNLKI